MGEEELLLESTGRRRLGAGFALISMVLVVGMVVAVAVSAKGTTDAAKSTPTGTPEILVLTHDRVGGLSFEHPSGWAKTGVASDSPGLHTLGLLGTAHGMVQCASATPAAEASGYVPDCVNELLLDPGQLVVGISFLDGPVLDNGPIDPLNASNGGGGTYVTVGGLPARMDKAGDDDQELILLWSLSVPEAPTSRYRIVARMAAPGIDRLRSQVEALIASIRYDPAPPKLDPADGPRIAGLALARLRKNDASFGCFPTTPGKSAHAIVSQLPGYATLSKALPVTCETAIEPKEIGVWKLTLTQTWAAASDRQAGSLATTIWVSSEGDPGMQTSSAAAVPYLGSS